MEIDGTYYKTNIIMSSLQLIFMNLRHLLLLTCLSVFTLTQFTQPKQSIDSFLRSSQNIPQTTEMTDFQETDGKYTIVYTQGPSHYKYVIKADSDGQYHIIFMEKIISVSKTLNINRGINGNLEEGFGEDFTETPVSMNPFEELRKFQNFESPSVIFSPVYRNEANSFFEELTQRGLGRKGFFNNRRQNRMHRKLNQNEIQELLLQKLPILEGGKIIEIEKNGFEKGILLTILYQKGDQKYNIDVTYRPRFHQLFINRLDKASKTPLDIGKELIGNFMQNIIQKKSEQQIKESVQQANVQGAAGQPERDPLLLGSEGEPERNPVLIGSEGQPERNQIVEEEMKESANEAISVHEEEESGEEISDLPNIDNLKTKKK